MVGMTEGPGFFFNHPPKINTHPHHPLHPCFTLHSRFDSFRFSISFTTNKDNEAKQS